MQNLVHHDSRPYEEAASDAARHARSRLEEQIARGRASGERILNKVMTEVPRDAIVSGNVLDFDGLVDERPRGAPDGVLVTYPGGEPLSPARFALGQLCARANIPVKYADYLTGDERSDWGTELLAHNLRNIYGNSKNKFLMRSWDGRLRGFLSDRFRRLDSRPLLEAFAGACQEVGALPIEGYGTETKVALKAIVPRVFEPAPNEVLAFGVMWENSDYGNGTHTIQAFIDRLWCTNYAIMTTGFKQIHLGKRLTDDINWSEETYAKDTAAVASAIRDVVDQTISPDAINNICAVVDRAHSQEINVEARLKSLRKQLTKTEAETIAGKFNSPDVQMLPPGNTSWRLSNAISWVAGHEVEDDERKIELMKLAGTVISRAA